MSKKAKNRTKSSKRNGKLRKLQGTCGRIAGTNTRVDMGKLENVDLNIQGRWRSVDRPGWGRQPDTGEIHEAKGEHRKKCKPR